MVLDTSAIVAYTRGSVAVGEILSELADEGAVAGLPVLCLVEARPSVVDTDLLDLLVIHDRTEVLGLAADDWQALIAATELVGRLDIASAVLAADEHEDATIMTARPSWYGGLDGGGPVLPI
ncbi:hypothetical protein [Catenuloplanes japonicus]|uniref:hypothetical protein n=1 Tax=Catenuloplanes japonicus TaxID=33876 RepID=UPI000B1ACCF4|nr:hypothetical protein [Catenuloplanes japonicus]